MTMLTETELKVSVSAMKIGEIVRYGLYKSFDESERLGNSLAVLQ